MGFVVSSVVFSIISSSVNAVIVCFASSPVSVPPIPSDITFDALSHVFANKQVDFHCNHPDLSAEMRAAWREVWPGCMDVVDIRLVVASYLDQEAHGEQKPLLG